MSADAEAETSESWEQIVQLVALTRAAPGEMSLPPPRGDAGRWRALRRFGLLVLLPTLLSGGYFGLLAPERYVSEARFVVRKPDAPGHSAAQSLSIDQLPKAAGGDDAYAVRDFIRSRDALHLLLRHADLRGIVATPARDPLWHFPGWFTGRTDEDLFDLYPSLVTVNYESSSGITTLRTQAFTPEAARRMAMVLLDGTEALLNRMSARAESDAVAIAAAAVTRARTASDEARARTTAFREQESLVDPTALSKTVLSTIEQLSQDLVESAAELNLIRQMSGSSPQIPTLRARVEALQQQIDHARDTLAGRNTSLAPRIAAYERLRLEQEFADQNLLHMETLLETARIDALRQHEYIERVVEPHAADEARYPRRVLWILGTALVGLALFWAFRPNDAAAPRAGRHA